MELRTYVGGARATPGPAAAASPAEAARPKKVESFIIISTRIKGGFENQTREKRRRLSAEKNELGETVVGAKERKGGKRGSYTSTFYSSELSANPWFRPSRQKMKVTPVTAVFLPLSDAGIVRRVHRRNWVRVVGPTEPTPQCPDPGTSLEYDRPTRPEFLELS